MRRFWAALGSLLFFVIAPGTIVGLVPWSIAGWRLRPAFFGFEALRLAGAALVLLGLIVLVEFFARFVWKGFGTPAPIAPPTKLVMTGFYRRVRNPIYVGLVTIVFGEALILGDDRLVVYAAILWLLFHFWVLVIEEPTLERSFGDDFANFRAKCSALVAQAYPLAGGYETLSQLRIAWRLASETPLRVGRHLAVILTGRDGGRLPEATRWNGAQVGGHGKLHS